MNTSPVIDLIALIELDLGQGHKSGRWMFFHCPFPGHKHGDRKPSLSVTNGDHSRPSWWKCWACDKGGGAVKWLMEYRGLLICRCSRSPRIPVDRYTPTHLRNADTATRHAARGHLASTGDATYTTCGSSSMG
ncbi:MAG: CHC2 zinc finger domain-containing protein [Anaerolineales bacterium]